LARIEKGDSLYGANKIFPDFKAEPGQKALVQIHGMFTEASVTLIALLTATRLQRKGYETTIMLYGPEGVLMASRTKGYPKVGDPVFPGHFNHTERLQQFIKEGGKVYACRIGLGLVGFREEDLIDGVEGLDPLDVADCVIYHAREGALVFSTWV
jgi:uncharacterized repeat protein (TIGR04044 family)